MGSETDVESLQERQQDIQTSTISLSRLHFITFKSSKEFKSLAAPDPEDGADVPREEEEEGSTR